MKEQRINDGGPAFPTTHHVRNGLGDLEPCAYPGLTFRRYVAAKVMAALCADTVNFGEPQFPLLARQAWVAADALIAAEAAATGADGGGG